MKTALSTVSIAEQAWEAAKDIGDPSFGALEGSFRENLVAREDGVRSSGITINKYEEKVKELIAEEKAKPENQTALGTNTDAKDLAQESAQAAQPAKEAEKTAVDAKTAKAVLDVPNKEAAKDTKESAK